MVCVINDNMYKIITAMHQRYYYLVKPYNSVSSISQQTDFDLNRKKIKKKITEPQHCIPIPSSFQLILLNLNHIFKYSATALVSIFMRTTQSFHLLHPLYMKFYTFAFHHNDYGFLLKICNFCIYGHEKSELTQ